MEWQLAPRSHGVERSRREELGLRLYVLRNPGSCLEPRGALVTYYAGTKNKMRRHVLDLVEAHDGVLSLLLLLKVGTIVP